MSGGNNVATLLLALSGAARSNGVINAGYICYMTMHRTYHAIFHGRKYYLALQVIAAGALRCLFIFIPFIAFQAYGYYNICMGSDQMRPWCKARLPLLYNYIQSHYWRVGFLRYFQLKQLPNFFLASPILSLAICSIIHYIKLQPQILLSLGFQSLLDEDKSSVLVGFPSGTDVRAKEGHAFRRRKQGLKRDNPVTHPLVNDSVNKSGYLSATILPFILHLGFMAATAFFVVHVQVATRFLSASPPLYWFASQLMVSSKISKRWGYLIWAYCAAYLLLGSLLFSNFYPFT
ncbi:hypothetical protein NMG60_11018972 [Bertholletia excelsa]